MVLAQSSSSRCPKTFLSRRKAMPAILEQTTVTPKIVLPASDPAQTIPSVPTVFYESLNSIDVFVIVSSTAPDALDFQAPVIAFQGPGQGQAPWTWTVTWNFVTDTGLEVDTLTVAPPVVSLTSGITMGPVQEPAPNQRQVTITLDEIMPLTLLSYSIMVNSVSHDPTIVVTPDPIDS
jgi:hypothetical protein